MVRESKLGYLIAQESALRSVAESTSRDQKPVIVVSALRLIRREMTHEGTPATQKEIAKLFSLLTNGNS